VRRVQAVQPLGVAAQDLVLGGLGEILTSLRAPMQSGHVVSLCG
jgi:hypothetical protein